METTVATYYTAGQVRRRAVTLSLYDGSGRVCRLRMCPAVDSTFLVFSYEHVLPVRVDVGDAVRVMLNAYALSASAGVWTSITWNCGVTFSYPRPTAYPLDTVTQWLPNAFFAPLLSFASPLARSRFAGPLLDYIGECLPDPWCHFPSDPLRMFRSLCPFPLAGVPREEADQPSATHPSTEAGGSLR